MNFLFFSLPIRNPVVLFKILHIHCTCDITVISDSTSVIVEIILHMLSLLNRSNVLGIRFTVFLRKKQTDRSIGSAHLQQKFLAIWSKQHYLNYIHTIRFYLLQAARSSTRVWNVRKIIATVPSWNNYCKKSFDSFIKVSTSVNCQHFWKKTAF